MTSLFFFFNDTATTEIYTLSLHDALPISSASTGHGHRQCDARLVFRWRAAQHRSEEHTSELQSPCNLVCRLLLEKKKLYILTAAFMCAALTLRVTSPASAAHRTTRTPILH